MVGGTGDVWAFLARRRLVTRPAVEVTGLACSAVGRHTGAKEAGASYPGPRDRELLAT